jgi:hypothetical protein
MIFLFIKKKIKSTLSNLPMYYLSLFPILVGVTNRLETSEGFFYGGTIGDEFKFY